MRNLVIGCDGTWNESEFARDGRAGNTNVVKFMQAMKSLRGRQLKHYEKGVGTRAWELLPGGIYGYGLEKRINGCYRFLCNRYRDAGCTRDDNRVFIIGFSRGAYTARRLAGLIAHSGLPQHPDDVELGWRMYVERDHTTAQALKQAGRFFDITIEMLGAWDTVKATDDADYRDNELSPNVRAGYHAMAIDERRRFFPVLRWNRDPRVLQVWFAGVHSDVGGGYLNAGLADIALNWMIHRALGHGLEFKKAHIDASVDPRPGAYLHNSLKGIWKPFGEQVRSILSNDFVHRAVAERLSEKADYRPPNLPAQPRYWPPGGA